jgi:hypothetical protein
LYVFQDRRLFAGLVGGKLRKIKLTEQGVRRFVFFGAVCAGLFIVCLKWGEGGGQLRNDW